MKELRRVVNNTVISLTGQAITWGSSFLLTIAYGRFLGDVKFGELFLALSLVALVGVPAEAGFNQQITRDVAQRPERATHYLANTLPLKFAVWLVAYGVLMGLTWLLHYTPEERALVAICGLTLLTTAVTSAFVSLYSAFQRQVFPVVGSIIERGSEAIVGFILLAHGAGVIAMALVLLAGSAANVLWQAAWFGRVIGFRFTLDTEIIRALLRTSVPFVLAGVLGVLYFRVDTVLLSLMTSDTVVGWYGAGYRLFDTLFFLPNIVISAVMYPVFAKYSAGAPEMLKRALGKTTDFIVLCGVPIATLLIFAAPSIVEFLYHRPEFSHTIPVLQILAPGLLLMYVNTIGGAVLTSTKREGKLPIIAGSALVFNLALNAVLILRFQHVGAAIATTLTELLLLGLMLRFVPRELLPAQSLPTVVKALAAAAPMAVAVLLLGRLSILLVAPLAFGVYVGAAALLGAVPREDLLALYDAVRNKAGAKRPVPALNVQEAE